MKVVQLKPKTVIYFVTFFLTGLALLYEILKQRGVNKIKAGYLKRLTKPLHTVGVIEENKAEGYVVIGGFIHTGSAKHDLHVSDNSLAACSQRFSNLAKNVSLGYTDKGPIIPANCRHVSWCRLLSEYVVNARHG